jgi:TatD DNase family protein
LDSDRYDEDLEEVISQSLIEGIEKIIIPGADIDDLPKAVKLSEKYSHIYFSVGIHPYHIDQYDEEKLIEYINHPKCVAVGECGLDYFRLPENENEKNKNIALQKEVFIAQINVAKKYNKPIIIHIRDASNDSKQILVENDSKLVGGVLHCFNADEQLLSLSEHGFYFGIGGVLTFKNGKKLKNVLPKIPLDKLVLETDAPYLTPEPHRGKRNEPRYTNYVATTMSELLDIELDKIKNITTTNANNLFFNTHNTIV